MYQALEVASSETAASAAASALHIYYVVIGGRFVPPYEQIVKSMVLFKHILARILKNNVDFFKMIFKIICLNLAKSS